MIVINLVNGHRVRTALLTVDQLAIAINASKREGSVQVIKAERVTFADGNTVVTPTTIVLDKIISFEDVAG